MSARRGASLNLADVARRSDQALKHITKAAKRATRLSTSEIYASIGFIAGAAGTYAGLIALAATGYGLFFVPIGALVGLLTGALLGRDRVDRNNERAAELADRAWQLRELEVASLKREITDARRRGSPGLTALEQKLTLLNLAAPQRLVDYYRLDNRGAATLPDAQIQLGPPDGDVLATWQVPTRQITDRRGD